jgi:hypothetical protein
MEIVNDTTMNSTLNSSQFEHEITEIFDNIITNFKQQWGINQNDISKHISTQEILNIIKIFLNAKQDILNNHIIFNQEQPSINNLNTLSKTDISKLKVSKLKEILKENRLSTNGIKKDLIERVCKITNKDELINNDEIVTYKKRGRKPKITTETNIIYSEQSKPKLDNLIEVDVIPIKIENKDYLIDDDKWLYILDNDEVSAELNIGTRIGKLINGKISS